jgi:predicted GTPase
MDLRGSAKISEEEVETVYRSKFSEIFHVSAVTGEGVGDLFTYAAHAAYRFTTSNHGVQHALIKKSNGGESGCC